MCTSRKNSYLSENIKYLLHFLVYSVFIITIYLLFAISISNTDNLSSLNENDSINVGTFNNTTLSNEEKITTFVNNLFKARNSSFLNGNVEMLSKFYNLNNTNSTHCLSNEFKRISYLRDWAIERNIILTSITSSITLKNIKDVGNTITFKVDENCTFKYIYSDNSTVNTFYVNLIHIFTLNKVDGTFQVEKDYYLDFLGNSSNKYNYRLDKYTIPYNVSINTDFAVNNTLDVGDILSYHKFNFVDHKGIVCGYDSKGYPLINSTTIYSSNLPYDLGWKTKNIYKD